jgi:hypothetical protein
MKKYTYHVAFMHETGMGTCTVKREKPIQTSSDISELEELIATENNLERAAIINFIRLKG